MTAEVLVASELCEGGTRLKLKFTTLGSTCLSIALNGSTLPAPRFLRHYGLVISHFPLHPPLFGFGCWTLDVPAPAFIVPLRPSSALRAPWSDFSVSAFQFSGFRISVVIRLGAHQKGMTKTPKRDTVRNFVGIEIASPPVEMSLSPI